MKVLVTGGAGYIGSHTCVELLEAGHEVIVVDDLVNSQVTALENVEKITGKRPAFYETDAADKAAMQRIFAEHRPDAVIHFAGLKAVGESCRIPLRYYRNNLDSTLALLAAMEAHGVPIRMISPGRVYRKDEVDATHSPMFHQIEGLVIDKGVTMADLKGTLETLIKAMYGEDSVIRFRPHHFPFTEPSCEVDVQCFKCRGAGCPTCKGEGWIELLGAGMVHPTVLAGCGIDPEIYSGFAFGIGLERMAMRRFQIGDLRMIFENDVRFLEQF